jgi:5,10-methylene-tetrahydrofolate dehydrogenase/methenyl tetrahydrofolate cyclohydrolase
MERTEGGRKHQRGQLTDNLYALFRQATVTDISKDLNFKKQCAGVLQAVFAELKLPPDQILDLVDFSLDVDALSSGSKKRVENRQDTSAAAATPDASLAASQKSSRAGVEAVPAVADHAV